MNIDHTIELILLFKKVRKFSHAAIVMKPIILNKIVITLKRARKFLGHPM